MAKSYFGQTNISATVSFANKFGTPALYEPWYNYSMNAYLGMKDGDWGVLKMLNVKNSAQVFSFADEGCLVKPGYFIQGLNDTALYPVWPTSEAPNWGPERRRQQMERQARPRFRGRPRRVHRRHRRLP
jgi:hypothetical protein